jgi:SAM-dependent methyltransferase
MTAADFNERADLTSVNRATYDRIARRYRDNQVSVVTPSAPLFTRVEESFAAALPPRALVADMGCGPGLDAAHLAGLGHRVVGVDLSAGMLDVARERLAGHLVQADLRRIPIGDGRLDGIWSVASLLHVPERDTAAVLGEFRRTLRATGTLALVTALGQGEQLEPVPYAPEESRWFVYRDPARLAAQLTAAGFVVRHQDQVQGSRLWFTLLATPT